MAPQETVSQGFRLVSRSSEVEPGSVLACLGDSGAHLPPWRGTKGMSGFLISFQLAAVGPGRSQITGEPYNGTVLHDDRGLITTSAPVSITVGASIFEDYFSNRVFLSGVTNFAAGNNSSYSKETGETTLVCGLWG